METVELKATIDQLYHVNNLLEDILIGKKSDMISKVQIITEELFSNICYYAYKGKVGAARFSCGEVNFDGKKAIMIQLSDDGMPFDPFSATLPDLFAPLEKRKIGGLGVYLVKQLAQHYTYMRINNSNQTQVFLLLDKKVD